MHELLLSQAGREAPEAEGLENHKKAMEWAELADRYKSEGKYELAKEELRCSFLSEFSAAETVRAQPARAILLKSAAYLAYEAELFEDARTTIGLALSETETPRWVIDELLELLETVNLSCGVPQK